MDIMEERRQERERDLFAGFDNEDNDDEKLTIIQDNNNENIELDYVDL